MPEQRTDAIAHGGADRAGWHDSCAATHRGTYPATDANAPPATAAPTQPPTAPATPTALPPTPTTAPPTDTPTAVPTDTPTAAPRSQTTRSANLRAGPGTNYAVVGSAAAQEAVEPLGRNEDGDWLQVNTSDGEAWIAAFLVENVADAELPVRQSTAPTLTPVPQSPAATAAPSDQASPAAGSVACGASVPAPQDLRYTDGAVTLIQAPQPLGTFSWTQKNLTWRWDGLDQVSGLDWYFDLQFMLGGQPGNPVLRTMPLPLHSPDAIGNWTMMAPGTSSSGGDDQNFFRDTCPAGEPRCPLHVRVQVALRDTNGNFVCFISAPSNIVQMPIP